MSYPNRSIPMSLEQLQPCRRCGANPLEQPRLFYRLTFDIFTVDTRALGSMVGTAIILGGTARAGGIARALSPCDPIAHGARIKQLLLCLACLCDPDTGVASLFDSEDPTSPSAAAGQTTEIPGDEPATPTHP